MSIIEIAKKIAEHAFKDKSDLVGEPYILHLERVVEKLKGKNEDIICVAWLHDLLEDCPEWNKDVLKCFFWSNIVDAVVALTKVKGEDYKTYISRVHANRYATIVKIADLQDNMNITRLNEIGEKDVKRLKKYLDAYKFLTGN